MFSDLKRSSSRVGAALAVALTLGVAAVGVAQDDAVEETSTGGIDNGAPWLQENVGARGMALQAVTPLADDAGTISANPAGLAGMDDTTVLFYTRESSYDLREHYLGAVLGYVGEKGTLGVSWRSVSAGDSDDAPFIGADASGNITGALAWRENAIEVGYGHEIDENLSIGGSLGLVFSKFDGLDDGAFADDASESGFRGLTLGVKGIASEVVQYGVALRSLGGGIGDADIAPALSAGVAIAFPQYDNALLAIDFEKQFVDLAESTTQIRMGTEYHLDPIALRLGTSQSSDRSRMFAGFGVNYDALQIDYAFQFVNRSARSLGDTPRHFVSLAYVY